MAENSNYNKMNDYAVPFEVAITKAGFGLYSYMLTCLTGLSIISYGCVIYSSTLIVPLSLCELETTGTQQGLLVAMPLVGTIVGAIVWGYLGDTRGRRNMLLVSFASGALVNSVASLSVNWIMLMMMQFIAALLASGQYSLAMTLLSECVPVVKRSLVMLIVASIFLLTQGIMSLIAMPIVNLDFSNYLPALDIYWNPWRAILLIYCTPSLICLVWFYFMQESPKFVFSKGDESRALEILSTIHRINNRHSKEELQVKSLMSEETNGAAGAMKDKPIKELLRMPLLKYFIIMTSLSIFMKGNPFVVWLPTIVNQFMDAIDSGGNNLTMCNMIETIPEAIEEPNCKLDQTALFIVFGVGGLQSVFNLLVSLVVDRLGRRNTVILVSAVCGVSGILVNVVPNTIGSAVLFVIFLLSLVLTGINTTITVGLFPTHLRALAVSLTMTGGRIALIADTMIINYLLNANCDLAFYLYTSMLASCAIIASFLPDDRKQRKAAAEEETPALEPKPGVQRYSTDRTSL